MVVKYFKPALLFRDSTSTSLDCLIREEKQMVPQVFEGSQGSFRAMRWMVALGETGTGIRALCP